MRRGEPIYSLIALPLEALEALQLIQPHQVIGIIKETLKRLDNRLVGHGDRVAFIAYELLCHSGRHDDDTILDICTMAFFHDIGAYKTEEIDRMLQFESHDVWRHSIYGYLFLKHFTPLGDAAEVILYHHLRYCDSDRADGSGYLNGAMLLHLCDRIDILLKGNGYSEEYLRAHSGDEFAPWCVDLFLEAQKERHIVERLADGSYLQQVQGLALKVCSSFEKALDYITTLIFVIDFKSQVTVTHTIHTVAFSVLLSRLMGQSKEEQCKVYLGALLHDLGKISTPNDILEKPGKLTYDEMKIMKQHVSVTYDILKDSIAPELCHIAARHHERLDGSGYPWGLAAEELTLSEQIVAVADVMSALVGRRSYKESFSQDKTVEILMKMADQGKLNPLVCGMIAEHYEEIMEETQSHCAGTIRAYHNLTLEYEQRLLEINDTHLA